jgi:hypothetical protein
VCGDSGLLFNKVDVMRREAIDGGRSGSVDDGVQATVHKLAHDAIKCYVCPPLPSFVSVYSLGEDEVCF